ncbi:MAG: glycosyltransferase family 4 protein [Xanthomonadaceae bacterium]|nr:glycosyltransferase family 4 protein [Xanthomonadaceae bacterium]
MSIDVSGSSAERMPERLVVAGVAMCGDGYPNAANTIALLKRELRCEIRDQAYWLPPNVRLWHLVKGSALKRVTLATRLGVGGLFQAARLLLGQRASDVVYLPYPAPLTLWWLSIIPRGWRPRCIADAYISLWDSMFRDRGGGDVRGVVSRIVRRFEARSLRAAALVLVDTEANKRQMIADFALSARRIRSIPLAINERLFPSSGREQAPSDRPARVLFVGTLVPLHGIDIVLAVAAELSKSDGIEFRLIGDGQQSALVEAFVRTGNVAGFTWIREWMPLADIAREIEEADVCLGVFGGEGKAARVLPFKSYCALAAGKAIVTQAAHSLPDGLPPLPAVLVAGTDRQKWARDVAAAIRTLIESRAERIALGNTAGQYFADHLSSQAIRAAWQEILCAANGRMDD